MSSAVDVEALLGVAALRAGFLRYTRQAYGRLPALARPRTLDIGCGTGAATLELARLTGGDVVGIDPDAAAVVATRRLVEAEAQHVTVVNASLLDVPFADESFDLLWEEGVLHLLDSALSLPACRRLLRPGGFLVMHETVAWLDGVRSALPGAGFGVHDELPLPGRAWWTDYYAPLEDRIRALRAVHGDAFAATELARHEREIAMVRAAPERFDCGFLVLQRER